MACVSIIFRVQKSYMATIKSFEEIEVWKKARVFAQKIYTQTTKGTFAKDFSLKDQINASAGSIMDNIAEGYGRGGNKEFITFLAYARGSADESRSQLYRAFDRQHLAQEIFVELRDDAIEISKMLTGFMTYLQGSDIRGSKFLEPVEDYQPINNPKT
jgi:four helix bundle protein